MKLLISRWGYIPLCFENTSICLDNLTTLDSELVLIGPFSLKTISNFVNIVKSAEFSLPVLIIGADIPTRGFVESNRFDNVMFERNDYNPSELKRKIQTLLLRPRVQGLADTPFLVGNSPEIIKLRKLIYEISRSDESVLIRGETGTGKDLAAQILHRWSDRRKSQLIKINIEALFKSRDPGNNSREKKTENRANGMNTLDEILKGKYPGILFLDKVDCLPSLYQEQLFVFLERNEKGLSGSGDTPKANNRVLASSSADLEKLVEKGQFRKDLLYRLSVFIVDIPPLRKHPEDIPILVDFVSNRYSRKLSNGICEIPENTKKLLREYSWPGNFSELEEICKRYIDSGFDQKIIDRVALKNDDANMNPEPEFEIGIPGLGNNMKGRKSFSMKGICKQIVAKTEKSLIMDALQLNKWNRRKTALMLDISYRSLLNKIKEYNIS